jgi:hypothetical protein
MSEGALKERRKVAGCRLPCWYFYDSSSLFVVKVELEFGRRKERRGKREEQSTVIQIL